MKLLPTQHLAARTTLPQQASRDAFSPCALPLIAALSLLAGCHKSPATYASGGVPPPPSPAASVRRHPPFHPAINVPPGAPDDIGQMPVSTEIGVASWYGPPYHGHQAADGSIFDQNALTAAHRTLPFGTVIRVTNLASQESVLVTITDRGPFVPNRVLDLSVAAAKNIDLYRMGLGKVRIEAFPNLMADPVGRWAVQIGPFLDQEGATQLKNDLTRRYQAAKVIQFSGMDGSWVRLTPPQQDRASASSIVEAIHIPDAYPFLVRLN